MSVVLFYHGNRVSVMASDSRCNSEGGGFTDSIRKTFSIHGGLLGVVGDAGTITDVRRTLWEEPEVAKVSKWPKGEYVALYMDKTGKLFEIDGGQIIPHDEVTVIGVGVGGDVALGAAEAWLRMKRIRRRDNLTEKQVEQMLRFSLQCAIAHNSQCGGRIMLKVCDLRELA